MWQLNKLTANVWKLIGFALRCCVIILLGLWILLLSTICSSPRSPVAATGNTIPYNCHGSIVFITSAQHAFLIWLIPALVLTGIGGVAATKKAKQRLKSGNPEAA
jgi:ABC-type microcin C transport system permease subunit YejB